VSATVASAAPVTTRRGGVVVLPGQTPGGEHVLSVLLKRTFDIVPGGICARAEEDVTIVPGDEFWDSPMNSSVKFETDFVPFKLATDVVINGTAHAPPGTTSCVVAVSIAARTKSVLVTGDRIAKYVKRGLPLFTDPQPFERMELRYERAYGGIDVFSDKTTTYPYPRNPVGRGFAVANSPDRIENLPLPNLEDPAAPLWPQQLCIEAYDRWEQQPLPAGFGWLGKTWYPRAQLAGILPGDRATEQEMRQAYAKLVPEDQREAYLKHGLPDMDFRFFNGASAGLAMPFLDGDETVTIQNLTPDGTQSFALPNDRPRLGLDIGNGVQEPEVVLQTVMLRMDERQADLVWRGAVPYPGRDWLPEMRKMDVFVT
jgi:hypothetical protein